MLNFELPSIKGATDTEKIKSIIQYLTRLTEQLNYTTDKLETQSNTETFGENNKSYIKSGILYYQGDSPVYGIGIGDMRPSTDERGRIVVDRSKQVALFTTKEISFWSNNKKVMSINSDKISISGWVAERGIIHSQSGRLGDYRIGSTAYNDCYLFTVLNTSGIEYWLLQENSIYSGIAAISMTYPTVISGGGGGTVV